MSEDRAASARRAYMAVLERYRRDFAEPGSAEYWSPSLETASRDEIRAIQNAKLEKLSPFLYENSDFYRRRFDAAGMIPDDIRTVDDLPKWRPVDKKEMVADMAAHPPWGTYTTHDDAIWSDRGWTIFPTSGSTGTPRVFRYSKTDLDYWKWANSRALWSLGARPGETVFLVVGFGPHVWGWGVLHALAHMGVPCIPGGGLTAELRCNFILRYRPTVLATLPSQLLRLGHVMRDLGHDPAQTSVTRLFTGGEPAAGIAATRRRLEEMWGAEVVEFYGCTEASPHSGGFSCSHPVRDDGTVQTHLMEDIQVWELCDPDNDMAAVPEGGRGITVCTNMNSESSSHLRFVVGDYTQLRHRALRLRPDPCPRARRLPGPGRRPDQPARRQVLSQRRGGGRARRRRRRRRIYGPAGHHRGGHRLHAHRGGARRPCRPGRASSPPCATP